MLKNVADSLALLSVKALCGVARCLPRSFCTSFLYGCIQLIMLIQPRHLRTGRANLQIVFPDMPPEEVERVLRQHLRSLATLIYDSLTLTGRDRQWAEQHVHFPNESQHKALQTESEVGVLIATGHLGSFELHAHTAALLDYPLSFVVRNFDLPRLDAWWCGTRERSGNTVINRKGAYKEIVRSLKNGRNVGILFDQNLVASHAVFVEWFGLEAATTKALALAALQTKAPMAVSALCQTENGKYELLWERLAVEAIYKDESLSKEEKMRSITEQATRAFSQMILQHPAQWFWLHRRWKTRPDGSRYSYQ